MTTPRTYEHGLKEIRKTVSSSQLVSMLDTNLGGGIHIPVTIEEPTKLSTFYESLPDNSTVRTGVLYPVENDALLIGFSRKSNTRNPSKTDEFEKIKLLSTHKLQILKETILGNTDINRENISIHETKKDSYLRFGYNIDDFEPIERELRDLKTSAVKTKIHHHSDSVDIQFGHPQRSAIASVKKERENHLRNKLYSEPLQLTCLECNTKSLITGAKSVIIGSQSNYNGEEDKLIYLCYNCNTIFEGPKNDLDFSNIDLTNPHSDVLTQLNGQFHNESQKLDTKDFSAIEYTELTKSNDVYTGHIINSRLNMYKYDTEYSMAITKQDCPLYEYPPSGKFPETSPAEQCGFCNTTIDELAYQITVLYCLKKDTDTYQSGSIMACKNCKQEIKQELKQAIQELDLIQEILARTI